MEQFMEIVAVTSMVITAGILFALNIMEDIQEKREEKLREAKAAHEEVKRRWKETEELK